MLYFQKFWPTLTEFFEQLIELLIAAQSAAAM
jgi:hypothetical protein